MAPNDSAHTVVNINDNQYTGNTYPRTGYHHIGPANEHDIELGPLENVFDQKVRADALYYVSPTNHKPVSMIVQSTGQASTKTPVRWNRVQITGNAPILLRLSSWVLGNDASADSYSSNNALVFGKTIIALPPQLLILMWPFHSSSPMTSFYRKFPSKTEDYPLYTRNQFDASPDAPSSVSWAGATYTISGDQKRLIQPRNLIVKDGNKWDITSDEGQTAQPYIVISYTTVHFRVDASRHGVIEELAEKMAEQAGVKAYWLDYKCRASQQPELTDDVHRICDVFRGARQVVVVLPDLTDKSKKEWGQRIWTLTEVLLSAAHEVKFVSPEQTVEYTKIDISREIWTDGEPTRLLAEHYSGLLTLSRLELISLGLNALSSRKSEKEWTPGDIAYALMALLRYRIRMNPNDTLFQALARLSLANDSDRIVERMICLLPDPEKTYDTSFVLDDSYGANLWDIEPFCQIAGVGENDEVIINGCRAISIRWKDFPRVHFVGNAVRTKLVCQYILRSVPAWVFPGLYFIIIYAITQGAINKAAGSSDVSVGGITLFYKYIGIIFLVIALVIAAVAPWLAIPVYGKSFPLSENSYLTTSTNEEYRRSSPGGITLAHWLRRRPSYPPN